MDNTKNIPKQLLIILLVYLYELLFIKVWCKYSNLIYNNFPIEMSFLIQIIIAIILLLPAIIFIIKYLRKNEQTLLKNKIDLFTIVKNTLKTVLFSYLLLTFTINNKNNNLFQWDSCYILSLIELFLFALPEEILYRGYFQYKLKCISSNKYFTTLTAGLMFAFMHYFNYDILSRSITLQFIAVGNYIAFHCIMNFFKEKSNSLLVPTIIHTLYNFTLIYL